MKRKNSANITVFCPSGHRLRGGTELMGRRVKCPKCKSEFVFAPSGNEANGLRPANAGRSTIEHQPKMQPVSESRVMAILSDTPPSQSPKSHQRSRRHRCPKCGDTVLDSQSTCPHCRTYLGVMPNFMRKLQDQADRYRQLG